MVGIDDVMFVRMSAGLDAEVHQRHLDELARAIDLRTTEQRIGVVYDAPSLDVDARRRQQSAAVLDARREKLELTTAGFALVTPSAVTRGGLRAVFWLAPPPYPWTVTDTVEAALGWLAPRLPSLDVDSVSRRYRAAVRELRR
jgi:hypothetical protein